MISFKQYILREGIITGLAGSQLGMNNTLNNFPATPPYGFWVDKSGNWLTVVDSHAVDARKIIKAAFKYKEDNNIAISDADLALFKEKLPGFGYPYRELYNHGFMHLVKAGNTYYYTPGTSGAISPSQRKFLSYIQDEYGMSAEIDKELI